MWGNVSYRMSCSSTGPLLPFIVLIFFNNFYENNLINLIARTQIPLFLPSWEQESLLKWVEWIKQILLEDDHDHHRSSKMASPARRADKSGMWEQPLKAITTKLKHVFCRALSLNIQRLGSKLHWFEKCLANV